METKSGISTEMEFSVSQQRATRAVTVQNATAKMELCLKDIQVSYDVFKCKLEVLKCSVKNQKSLQDVKNTMHGFRTYFRHVEAYSKSTEESLEHQLKIILGEDSDRQILSLENDVSPTWNHLISDKNRGYNNDEPSCSRSLEKLALTNESCISLNKSRNMSSLENEGAKSSFKENNGQPQSDNTDNDNNPEPLALQNLMNTHESYDSSNDLPEAQANMLTESKSVPNLPDSDQRISDVYNSPSPIDVNSVLGSNMKPGNVPEESCSFKNMNSNTKLSEKNAMESEISENIQRSSFSAMFEESQGDRLLEKQQSMNPQEEQNTIQQNEIIENEVEINSGRRLLNDADLYVEDEDVNDLKNERRELKKRNVMDATSKKVNDWLNTSVQSGHLSDENASDAEEFPNIDEKGDEESDSTTQIGEPDPVLDDAMKARAVNAVEFNDDNSLVSANDDGDHNSTSTKVSLNKENKFHKNINLAFGSEGIIELSDDEIEATSVHIKKGSNQRCEKDMSSASMPSAKGKFVREKDDCIEVVELEEIGDNDFDNDICVIESSQEVKKSCENKNFYRSTHSFSDSSNSSEPDKPKNPNDKISSQSQLNGYLETSSEKFISNVATEEISSLILDDEAKRKLLASSSSSCASSKGSPSETSDSNSTVIIKKNKRLKKKKRRKELNKSVSQSEVNSTDEETEINRLLDLKSLRKRRRESGSSRGSAGISAENSSVSSSSDKIKRKKKKKKSKMEENEMNLFSDANSTQNNQNSALESDHSNFLPSSPIREPTLIDDADVIHRNMLLASESSSGSTDECPASPEVCEPPKNKKKTSASKDTLKELDKENFLEEDCSKKKKRKYDPLLQGKFLLSDSECEPDKVTLSQNRKITDQKYEKLLEKSRKRKEASRNVLKENFGNSSDDENSYQSTNNSGNEQKNAKKDPVNFVSCDPECVEISEDDSDEDDRSTVGLHEISSDSERDDIQCIPQSQDTVASSKSGRKNIKKMISSKELTEESKKAVKEEEERRRRVLEKEKLLSQMFDRPEVQKLILDFDKDSKQELVTVHPGLTEVLKEHQIEGVKFMWNTCFETVHLTKTTSGSGCVLAHCMGLGKSLQIVTLIHTIVNHPDLNLRTALIMCPKSVVYNWADEFNTWLKRIEEIDPSSKKVEIFDLTNFKETSMKEKRLRHWQKNGGVMIISYAVFRTLVKSKDNVDEHLKILNQDIKKHLIDPGPDVIVFDEGHILKNDSTDIHRAVDEVRTKRRIVLTGTPMQNSLMEYYFMVNLVKPNYLGDKKEFSNRFFNPINNGQFKDSTPQDVKIMKSRAHVLFKKMDGIVHRYDSNVIERLLPKKRFEFVLKLRLTKPQINLYKSLIDSLKNEDASGSGETQKERHSRFLRNERILHHICSHPKILTDYAAPAKGQLNVKNDWKKCLEGIDVNDVKLSPKTVLFFEILQKCRENGEKLLVFSQHLKSLNLLEYFLKKGNSVNSDIHQPNNSENKETWIREKDYFRLDGQTPAADRHKYCNIFNSRSNKRLRLGLLSTKAGSLGMNLIGANRAIIFDVSWNPASDSQSVCRIYRFGQEKFCYVYRFVTKGTMEEKKYHRQVFKLSTSSRVVDKRQVGRHYLEGQLRELYDYNFDYDENRSIPKVPPDNVLAELLLKSDCIENFEEHDYLLRNILDEELSEEDRRKAWEDYEREKNAPPPSTSNANTQPQGLPGIFSHSTPNVAATGIGHGQPSFSGNHQRVPLPTSDANLPFHEYFNHTTRSETAPEMNYPMSNFPNHPPQDVNLGPNKGRKPTAVNELLKRNKIERDLQRKVDNLLKNNIIPLPYHPLKKPEVAPENEVTSANSMSKKNGDQISKPEMKVRNPVNPSQGSILNRGQKTCIAKPTNPADGNNKPNVASSTPKKNANESGGEDPNLLQRLYDKLSSENNDASNRFGTSDKFEGSIQNLDEIRASGNHPRADSVLINQLADDRTTTSADDKTTSPTIAKTTLPESNITTSAAGVKTTPPAINVTTSPAVAKTTPLASDITTPASGAKTIPPATSSITADEGEISLKNFVEGLKIFVNSKKMSDSAS